MACIWLWSLSFAGALSIALKLIHGLWWKSKMIERKLKAQGVNAVPHIPRARRREAGKPGQLFHDIAPLIWPSYPDNMTTYGRIFFNWHRKKMPALIILDTKMIQEVLAKPMEFGKPEVHWTMKYVLMGLANLNGGQWLSHRKIINPAFHMEKLKQMMPAFVACCDDLIERWEKKIGQNESCELDALVEFVYLTEDIISRAAFGIDHDKSGMIFKLQRQQSTLFLRSFVTASQPWSRFLPTRLKTQMKKIRAEVSSLIGAIVDERQEAIASGKRDNEDLLTALLNANLSENQENGNHQVDGMTREAIIEECKLFYFAGHETTANLLTWTLILLGVHLDWQERARDEVLRTFGNNQLPTFDQLSSLKIVNMILLEVLRLYPPSSIIRSTLKEATVGNLTVPAGVFVEVPVFMIHRDAEVWGDDALEFNPDRFCHGVSKALKLKDQAGFFPFGWGPRMCIGQNFALTEAKLSLVLILQRFSVELSPTYTHAPAVRLTLQPTLGAPIVLRRRPGWAPPCSGGDRSIQSLTSSPATESCASKG